MSTTFISQGEGETHTAQQQQERECISHHPQHGLGATSLSFGKEDGSGLGNLPQTCTAHRPGSETRRATPIMHHHTRMHSNSTAREPPDGSITHAHETSMRSRGRCGNGRRSRACCSSWVECSASRGARGRRRSNQARRRWTSEADLGVWDVDEEKSFQGGGGRSRGTASIGDAGAARSVRAAEPHLSLPLSASTGESTMLAVYFRLHLIRLIDRTQ